VGYHHYNKIITCSFLLTEHVSKNFAHYVFYIKFHVVHIESLVKMWWCCVHLPLCTFGWCRYTRFGVFTWCSVPLLHTCLLQACMKLRWEALNCLVWQGKLYSVYVGKKRNLFASFVFRLVISPTIFPLLCFIVSYRGKSYCTFFCLTETLTF
jgi:hypothetical protein